MLVVCEETSEIGSVVETRHDSADFDLWQAWEARATILGGDASSFSTKLPLRSLHHFAPSATTSHFTLSSISIVLSSLRVS